MSLHVDSVHKWYGDLSVLKSVFLKVNKGEVLGLLGRNGSGKSTLLKIIHHSIQAQGKYVNADGHTIANLQQAVNYITYLPQNGFLPRFEKVESIIDLKTTSKSQKLKLNKVIKPLLKQRCGKLSGGESRFLEVMLVLHSPRPYILLDEPFNGMSPLYKDDIKNFIQNKCGQKGIIITDHDYQNVLDISTNLTVLVEGRTIALTRKSDLIKYGYLPISAI